MGETRWYRGEGGSVIAMDLPLDPNIARRVEAGAIVRVHPDGTCYLEPTPADTDQVSDQVAAAAVEEEPLPMQKPAPGDLKARWVEYAASTGQITTADAEAMTKAELIARFGA